MPGDVAPHETVDVGVVLRATEGNYDGSNDRRDDPSSAWRSPVATTAT
jgi:hypothetical protein